MGIFGTLFGWATWWEGAPMLHGRSIRGGRRVGEDAAGNVYFEGKPMPDGRLRRYVIYAGANDASRIAPEWYSWIHHQIDDVPAVSLPPVRSWEKAPQPNLTGTPEGYRPAGALEAGGTRAAATGDYEAWSPESA